MFVVLQRTDTLPEMRALVNSDHIISMAPVAGGLKSRLTLSNGEVWEIALPFPRAISLLKAEVEIVEPIVPVDRRREFERRQDPDTSEQGERRQEFVERRRPTT
jgi:hypothetical protein